MRRNKDVHRYHVHHENSLGMILYDMKCSSSLGYIRNLDGSTCDLRIKSIDEEEQALEDLIAMPEGKIGAKKRKKLEMKAEKRLQRERDLEDREEMKQRQAAEEARKQLDEQKKKEEEAERAAEEERLKKEQEQRELEEYLRMKEAFSVEGEGFDAATQEQASPSFAQNKLHEFIEYIKAEKVVILEDLAAKFQLKTQ
ncbi:unnamed protein product, partial [Ixodes persulcatus]